MNRYFVLGNVKTIKYYDPEIRLTPEIELIPRHYGNF